MNNAVTTAALVLLTLTATAASVLAIVQLRRGEVDTSLRQWRRGLEWATTLGAAAVFVLRVRFVHQGWAPLAAHVDGLLLLAVLLGATTLLLNRPAYLPGISAFASPVQALLLCWAICASSFTMTLFELGSFWSNLHLVSVYVGGLFFAVAASAGGMFLYRQRQLRSKDAVHDKRPFASLERIENVMIRSSALAFAALTLTVVMGAVLASTSDESVDTRVWVKIGLAAVIWFIYLIVMNVQHATVFRGTRAAWLSIAALVLILATFGVAVSGDSPGDATTTHDREAS